MGPGPGLGGRRRARLCPLLTSHPAQPPPISLGAREGASGGPESCGSGRTVQPSHPALQGVPVRAHPHPDGDREESEGDGGLGAAVPQEELLGRRAVPLVGQEAETQEPGACPEDWGRRREERGRGERFRKGCWAWKGPLPPASVRRAAGVELHCPQPQVAVYISINSNKIQNNSAPPGQCGSVV